MEPALAITAELAGSVNDVPVRGQGSVRLSLLLGRCRIELTVEPVPLRWDPLLTVLAVLDAALFAALQPLDEDAFPDRVATLRDEQGREVGFERCTAHLSRDNGEVGCWIQLGDRARMQPVERVVGTVEGAALAAALGGNLLTLASSYALETSWGNGYRLAATTAAESSGEVAGLRPVLNTVRLGAPERGRLDRRGERVVVEAEVDVRELAAAPRRE